MALQLEDGDRGIVDRGIEGRGVAGRAPPALTAQERSIVDEALLRGASVEDVMGILFARALPRSDVGRPAFLLGRPAPSVEDAFEPPFPVRRRETRAEQALRGYSESAVVQTPWELDRSRAIVASRIAEVEALLPLVAARSSAYVEHAQREFVGLSQFVQGQFEPIKIAPYIDPYSTRLEKYVAMRGAYYRSGWPFIKRDVLDLIEPASFFGSPIRTGVHKELKELLATVEADVRKNHPGLPDAIFPNAAGFAIGGFVPRFQKGSSVLSFHAFGLAIDVDADWNPQIKSPAAIQAFKRATGEDMSVLFVRTSSVDQFRKMHARIAEASRMLMTWLAEWLVKYDQIEEERKKARADKNAKQKLAALDREVSANPHLAALKTLIDEYKRKTIDQWRAYGIITIPPEVIESFVRKGAKNDARWGGEYHTSKDIMHLELLRLAAPKSEGRPGRSGRRPAVEGLSDLLAPNAHPTPVNGPP